MEVERGQDKARIAELERQLAAANKNSRNSSKPPSTDITKPPTDPKRKHSRSRKRRIGGQNRNAFAFIAESVRTFYDGQPQPSLLPVD